MMSKQQVSRSRREGRVPEEPSRDGAVRQDEVLAGIDDLLDEIDTVLEEQSVLVNFRQRAGQ